MSQRQIRSQTRAQILLRSVDRRQSAAAIPSATSSAPIIPPVESSRCSAKSEPGASIFTTTIWCRSTPRPPSATGSSANSQQRLQRQRGIVVPMATVSLFFHPVFRDGAFTANDPDVRAYALQKTMPAMDLGAELGAKIFVLWGGREGVETDACRRPDEAVKRLREAVNYLCEYNIEQKYGYKFALEAKPNEPRGDIYMATTGHYLGFIPTLDHPEMVGVNPEVAHETNGRPQFPARRRASMGSRQALPHRSERSGSRPLRSGFPLRLGESQSPRFSW